MLNRKIQRAVSDLTLLFFVSTLFLACSKSLIPYKATEMFWSGGVEGNQGINYQIILQGRTIDKLQPDSLYVHGKGFKLKASNKADEGAIWYRHTLENEASIVIYVQEYTGTDVGFYSETPNEQTFYPEFSGAAMLTYYHNNQQGFMLIKEFTALPSQAYP
jgi:hypothetical protein